MPLAPLTDDYAPQRGELHRIATHILARRRFSVAGRLGLRATPGGVATPMFGEREEVLRISDGWLLHEQRAEDGARTRAIELQGSTLDELAQFAGCDLDEAFSAGHDTVPLGDRAIRIAIAPATLSVIANWFAAAAEALDSIIGGHAPVAPPAAPAAVQLWPEHLDLATDLAAGPTRVNVGASAGDGFCAEPYAYVGPWDAARPGDAAFWNAPFGAVRRYSEIGTGDPIAALRAFWSQGIAVLGG